MTGSCLSCILTQEFQSPIVVVSCVYICHQFQRNEVARTHKINLRGDEIKIRSLKVHNRKYKLLKVVSNMRVMFSLFYALR